MIIIIMTIIVVVIVIIIIIVISQLTGLSGELSRTTTGNWPGASRFRDVKVQFSSVFRD